MRLPSIRALLVAALLAAPAACDEPAPMAAPASERPLYVDPARVDADRQAFIAAYRRQRGEPRLLYAAWLDRIGANGILDAIEAEVPRCHSEAHDLGRLVYSRLGEIGESLRACDRRCHSGCMHGVLMEAFTAMCSVDGQLRFELLAPSVDLVCEGDPQMRADYSPGDCAHGVGHALMFLADYGVERALEACGGFRAETMRYYCATGAYMEYVTAGRADVTLAEAGFAPCDAHPYPAACARYLMPRLLYQELTATGSPRRALALCPTQEGAARLGCFHGLGNAYMPYIARGDASLDEVCLGRAPEERRMCIEGAIERMARYEPERAVEVCGGLSGEAARICERARRDGMYAMDKDLRLYRVDAGGRPEPPPRDIP